MERRKMNGERAAVLLATFCIACGRVNASGSTDDVPAGIYLDESMLILKCGSSDTLTASMYPADAKASKLVWTIDDEQVAVVDDGIVRAVSNGSATVTVTTKDGGYKAACTIYVNEDGSNFRSSGPGGMPNGQGGPGGMPGMQGGPGGMPNGQGGPGGMPNGQGGPGGMPGMQGGPGGMPGGGQVSDESTATDPNAYVQASGETELSGKAYSSSTSDANAVKVTGGKLTLNNCTLTKDGGNSTSADGSSFYGTNAGVLASKDGEIIINGGSITTNAVGANGIVAYGGTVNVSNMSIRCANRLSRGIHATGGGTINAYNLDIATQEANSSVIALDRGGGSVKVYGGNYTAAGRDCAVLYSTGDITVNNITGSSEQGEIGVIEGDNFIAINNSNLISHANASSRGLMILQSGSGDAGEGLNGIITVAGGSLTMTDNEASLIEIVTNVTGKVTLDGVKLTIPSGILMTVDYNRRWNTNGATGVLVLSGEGTTYDGSVVADQYSSAQVSVNKGVTWNGSFNNADSAKSATLILNGGTWCLTADSNVDSIVLKGNAVINKNGFTLHCDDISVLAGVINN